MKRLLILLIFSQCHTGQPLSKSHVESSWYKKSVLPDGQLKIEFQVLMLEVPPSMQCSTLVVNGDTLSDFQEALEKTSSRIVSGSRQYPAPPNNRGYDPLGQGEPGSILYFQEEFKGKLYYHLEGRLDSLKIRSFKVKD